MNKLESNDGRNRVGIYLQEMGKFPLLSKKEEREIGQKAKNGDEGAKKQLIESNLRLVVFMATKYLGYLDGKLTFLDLIQAGNVGLSEAAEKFDPERNTKFSTYARYWIRLRISRALREQRLIHLPFAVLEELNRSKKISNRYLEERGRQPTFEELVQETGLPVEKVKKILQLPKVITSLEKPVRGDTSWNPTVIADFVPDQNTVNPEKVIQKKELKKLTINALSSLRPREDKVLRMRQGIGEKRNYTLQEIGNDFQVTKEWTRQIEKMALEKLRHPKRKRLLEGLLE